MGSVKAADLQGKKDNMFCPEKILKIGNTVDGAVAKAQRKSMETVGEEIVYGGLQLLRQNMGRVHLECRLSAGEDLGLCIGGKGEKLRKLFKSLFCLGLVPVIDLRMDALL